MLNPLPTTRESQVIICSFPSHRNLRGFRSSANTWSTRLTPKDGRSTQNSWARRWASIKILTVTTVDFKAMFGGPFALWSIPGLHAKHWTRQQVVDFFHEHSSVDETNVQRETDRYIAWPGQALGYKIGQLKLLEFRQRAQAALGSRFDIKKFHDLILDSGAVPLDILSTQVDQWIASQ